MSFFFSSFIRRRLVGTRVFKSTGIWTNSINYSSCLPRRPLPPPPPPLFSNVSSKFHHINELGNGKESRIPIIGELELGDNLELAGSSHGWIGLYNDDDVFLWNPMNNNNSHIIKQLPPLHTLPDPEVNSGGGVSRLALSSSCPDDDDCRAVIIVGRARRLAFCAAPARARGRGWIQIGDHYCERWHCYGVRREAAPKEYEDVVYSTSHRLFFCITRAGCELEAWNLQQPESPVIDWRLRSDEDNQLMFERPSYDWPEANDDIRACWHLKYLVLINDELFLVVRHVSPRGSFYWEDLQGYYSKYRGCDHSLPYKTLHFDVYRVDRQLRKLRHVKDGSLGGAALFVGMNHSYAAASAPELGLEPDSIYFADEKRLMRLSQSDVYNRYGGHDNGVFNYKTKTFSDSPFNMKKEERRIDPPPLWLI